MKKIILLALLTCTLTVMGAGKTKVKNTAARAGSVTTKLDTFYYDNEWKGVSNKAFASYYRITDNNTDPKFLKKFRDYYSTGELQAEGGYVSIDKYDDTKSVLDGPWVAYYKSGKIEAKGTRVNGLDEGEYTSYFENGLIRSYGHYHEGKLVGLVSRFSEDGLMCRQDSYLADGKPQFDYYELTNSDGYMSRYKLANDSVMWDEATLSDCRIEPRYGKPWYYYAQDGILVAAANETIKKYGKYYQIKVVIANHSMQPIELDPGKTKALVRDQPMNEIPLEVLSSEEYAKRTNRTAKWNTALSGFTEGIAVANAGYSTPMKKTKKSKKNASVQIPVPTSDSGTAKEVSYTLNLGGDDSGAMPSTTKIDDAAVAYQSHIIASQSMAPYPEIEMDDENVKQMGYLQKTTVYPGETISGYINIKLVESKTLYLQLFVNNMPYPFEWNFK